MITARLADPPLAGWDEELMEALAQECVPIVDAMCEIVAEEYRRKLSTTGSAEPGAPPRKRSGRLLGSITTRPARRRGRYKIVGEAGSVGVEYAARQEYGGQDSRGRMAQPHPWRRPGEIAAAPRLEDLLQRTVVDGAPAPVAGGG